MSGFALYFIIIYQPLSIGALYPSSQVGFLNRTIKVHRILGLNIPKFRHSLYFLNGNDDRQLNVAQCHKVNSIIKNGNFKSSVLLYNGMEAIRKQRMWSQKLSWIKPFYAIKANPSALILQDFKQQNSGFDCASKSEIKQTLAIGVEASQIVYSNPVKDEHDLEWANKKGIRLTTADSFDELLKIQQIAPNMDILWRISIKEEASDNLATAFSGKFGDDIQTSEQIHHRMKSIQELGIKLKGIHFHCGSGHHGSSGFRKAVLLARQCLQIGRQYDHQMSLLDIGGGFPSGDLNDKTISALQLTKKDPLLYKVIAEPGRHMCANSFYLLTKVLGRRVKNGKVCYHLNQSVYHSFNCNLMDGASFQNQSNTFYNKINQNDNALSAVGTQHKSTLFGMTCDGMDIISNSINVPTSLEVGDWICISGMGAYTYGCRSKFNGMSSTDQVIRFSAQFSKDESAVETQRQISLPYEMLVI